MQKAPISWNHLNNFFYNQFIVLRLEDGTGNLILNVHFCSKVWGWSDFFFFFNNYFLLTKAAFI